MCVCKRAYTVPTRCVVVVFRVPSFAQNFVKFVDDGRNNARRAAKGKRLERTRARTRAKYPVTFRAFARAKRREPSSRRIYATRACCARSRYYRRPYIRRLAFAEYLHTAARSTSMCSLPFGRTRLNAAHGLRARAPSAFWKKHRTTRARLSVLLTTNATRARRSISTNVRRHSAASGTRASKESSASNDTRRVAAETTTRAHRSRVCTHVCMCVHTHDLVCRGASVRRANAVHSRERNHRVTRITDPQTGVAQDSLVTRAAMCVRLVDVRITCGLHDDAQLAAVFIDPRAK